MNLTAKIVHQMLEYSDNVSLKNQCKMVLDSYLHQEPDLTEDELKQSLKQYLSGLE